MDSPKFQELYKQLNTEQKEAVDHIEGPVMVVAGPGTGKTQVLTLRIANVLLKTQVDPGNILALTFSESGAATMRRRLAEIIGSVAYQVQIATFHGFCNNLIQTYPEEFENIIGRQPANEVQQIEVLQKIIDGNRLQFLKPFGEPYFYLPEIRRSVSQLKKEGVSPEGFEKIISQEQKSFETIDDLFYESGRYKGKMKGKYADLKKQIDKNKELSAVYARYQIELKEAKIYDYEDMILEAVRALSSNPDFLLKLQEKFQYFLVDEHQDTNGAQNKVLELLSGFYDQPNLFVVGDEKQAIFRFQGASLANFLYFKKLYPSARLVTLNKNYRSTQSILDLTHHFIQNNLLRLAAEMPEVKDELFAQAKHPEQKVEVYEFKNPENESFFLSEKISELLKKGVPAKDIAVIYRDNRDAFAVTDALSKAGLSFRVESAGDVLKDEDIRNLINIFRFVANPSDEEHLFPILCASWLSISPLDIYKLNSPNIRKRSLIEMMADGNRLKELKVSSFAEVSNLAANLLNWHKIARSSSLSELFEEIVRESGFLSYVLNRPDSVLKLQRLNALFKEAKKISLVHKEARISDFINYLNTLEKHNIGVKDAGLSHVSDAVRLMTAHGSKGLEFDYVFVVNVFDGHWGNRRIPQLIKLPDLSMAGGNPPSSPRPGEPVPSVPPLRGSPSATGFRGELPPAILSLDDERRLFYVALTRARKMAYISYALQRADGRECAASQFITEIKLELKINCSTEKYENDLEGRTSLIFKPRTSKGFSIFEKEYLSELFRKRGLSATAVNNFLTCPWKYFYLNLLRIPRAKSRHQMYGSAVHAALKNFFDKMDYGKNDPEILFSGFKKSLEKELLGADELEDFLAKGNEALVKYHGHYKDSWNRKTLNEFRINNLFLNDNIKLTGSLDKIEFCADNMPLHPDPGNQSRWFPPLGSLSTIGFRGILSASNFNQVNVVDYKTGRTVSRNEIEGKTKNATGDYKRQLVFYKLLLDSYPGNKFNMISGELDFIEPDAKGTFHKEKFLIDTGEVDELKHSIVCIADKIMNFKFENERCGDRDCEYCQLRFNIV